MAEQANSNGGLAARTMRVGLLFACRRMKQHALQVHPGSVFHQGAVPLRGDAPHQRTGCARPLERSAAVPVTLEAVTVQRPSVRAGAEACPPRPRSAKTLHSVFHAQRRPGPIGAVGGRRGSAVFVRAGLRGVGAGRRRGFGREGFTLRCTAQALPTLPLATFRHAPPARGG